MCRESQPLLHPFQGRKAGREASCCPSTSQREREVEEKDPVWIWHLETHGETTISSKLCICWSSAAGLTSRGCALLDPYVILCSQSQDPTVGFVGPHQEKAPELKRFPGSSDQATSSSLPQVLLPAEISLSFPPLSHLPGGSGGTCWLWLWWHSKTPWIQAMHPNPPSILQNIPCLWRKASPDMPSAPPAFPHSSLSHQLFPLFPFWSQFPSLTGPQLCKWM